MYSVTSSLKMQINPNGEQGFELDLEPSMDIHDVKQLASEMCNVLSEHKRVMYKVRILRQEETVAVCGLDASSSGQASVEGGATPLKYSVRRVATDKIGCRVIHRLLEYCPMNRRAESCNVCEDGIAAHLSRD